jgi:hypothetical protein
VQQARQVHREFNEILDLLVLIEIQVQLVLNEIREQQVQLVLNDLNETQDQIELIEILEQRERLALSETQARLDCMLYELLEQVMIWLSL